MTRPIASALLAALTLAACHSEATRDKIEAIESQEAAPAATAPATAPAKAFSVEEKDELLDFSYGWPPEAAAIPALDKRFRTEMDAARSEALDTAADDKKARTPDYPFNGHQFSRHWETAGQSPALLSLVGQTSFFTGGAHPNHGSNALLWDRAAGREIKVDALFAKQDALPAAVSKGWCEGLDRERAKKRGDEGPLGLDEFNKCPPLSDISIVPTDSDGDGRFERFRLLADPYVAGPYAEGDYEVEVPVTAAMIEAITPGYRTSFALLQPPQ